MDSTVILVLIFHTIISFTFPHRFFNKVIHRVFPESYWRNDETFTLILNSL